MKDENWMMEPSEQYYPHRGGWVRDSVFGLNDGLVTTLGIGVTPLWWTG